MSYTYKTLTSTEVPLFKNLLRIFGEAFEEMDTYQSAVPGEAYLRDLLGQPHFIALVALEGDAVIGGLAAYALQKSSKCAKNSTFMISRSRPSIAGKGLPPISFGNFSGWPKNGAFMSSLFKRIRETRPRYACTSPLA